MIACPDREMALHAFVDGELDAIGAASFEAHARTCGACTEELERVLAVRAALQDHAPAFRAPASLKSRIDGLVGGTGTVDRTEQRRGPGFSWGSFASGGAIGALAVSLALFLMMPQTTEPGLTDQLVASHVRSLQAAHLVDIATSDRHVVKPWFNGRIDFAPAVPDLAGQGFPLVGGRLDLIDGRTAAALVYKRRLHSINLFVRPVNDRASSSGTPLRHGSYSLVHWTTNGLDYWAVSDIEPADLLQFAQAFRSKTINPGPPSK